MPFNMFGSVYRNQVFGTFNRQANCQGTPQYCGNPNAQLPGWLQQLEGNCTPRCMACLNLGFVPTPHWTLLNLIVNNVWDGADHKQQKFSLFQHLYANREYTIQFNVPLLETLATDVAAFENDHKQEFNDLFTQIDAGMNFDNEDFFTTAANQLQQLTLAISNQAQASQAAYMLGNKLNTIVNNQKKIQRVVGVSESEFVSNLASAVVSNGSRLTQRQINTLTPASLRPFYGAGTWNQASDRALPAGSRIKKPKTGSSIHVGVGVDVKHNSYARYLARLKGKNLKVKNVSNTILQQIVNTLNKNKPVVNNKPLPLMIVQQAGKTQNVCACPI